VLACYHGLQQATRQLLALKINSRHLAPIYRASFLFHNVSQGQFQALKMNTAESDTDSTTIYNLWLSQNKNVYNNCNQSQIITSVRRACKFLAWNRTVF